MNHLCESGRIVRVDSDATAGNGGVSISAYERGSELPELPTDEEQVEVLTEMLARLRS